MKDFKDFEEELRVPKLTFEDHKRALSRIKPSVNLKELDKFQEWTDDFGETGTSFKRKKNKTKENKSHTKRTFQESTKTDTMTLERHLFFIMLYICLIFVLFQMISPYIL